MGQAVRKRVPVLPRHMERPKKKASAEETSEPRTLGRESAAVLLFALGVFLAVALYSNLSGKAFVLAVNPQATMAISHIPVNTMGRVGMWISDLLISLLGYCAFVVAIWAFLLGRTVWKFGWPTRASESLNGFGVSVVGSVFMVASSAAMVSVFLGDAGGGKVGSRIAYFLIRYVNDVGAILICLVIFVLSLGIGTGIGTSTLIARLSSLANNLKSWSGDSWFVASTLGSAIRISAVYVIEVLATTIEYVCSGIRDLFIMIFRIPFVVIATALAPFRRQRGNGSSSDTTQISRSTEDTFVLGIDELDDEEEDEDDDEEEEEEAPPVRRRTKLSVASFSLKPKEEEEEPKEKVSLSEKLKISRGEKAKKIKKHSIIARGKSKKKSKTQKKEQSYQLPPLEILISGDSEPSVAPQDSELMDNSRRLEQTFADFRIGGQVVEVHPGPVVTLYEFQPVAGVKVQRIIALADDLALALKVASVRVYAPVPGKGTVGIEVPNAHREIVRLRDILDSDEYLGSEGDLKLALAKTTFGEPYTADLARMPHLLIAGATGTGKSVCINSVLLSLLYRYGPDELQFILIDPKMLELSMYEGIPHLKAPVVTNPKRARGVLWWAVEEMERRYCLMKERGVRNLASYNKSVAGEEVDHSETEVETEEAAIELGHRDMVGTPSVLPDGSVAKKAKHEKLPWIVIVVDELADLMLTVGREIEELITRLAQKARAAGIHLILATQRPSVNVITGLIKANFSCRISFQVASRIDARTVLDTSGAEKLLGRGDMLFLPPGTGRIKRLHAPFVSDKEVYDVVSHIRAQGGPRYDADIENMIKKIEDSEASGGSGDGQDDYDELYDQAVALVIEKGQASTSMVQRAFRIGYNRAARILETMEREGVVGPADGAKPRQVIVGGGARAI